MGRPVTEKQDRFARAYIETGCASTAYRRAYDCKSTTDKSVHENASKLLRHAKVAPRVEQLRSEHRQRHDITVDRLTAMLLEERRIAHAAGRPAVDAVMGIARLHGLVIDRSKSEHTGADGKPLVPIVNVTMGAARETRETPNGSMQVAQRLPNGAATKEP